MGQLEPGTRIAERYCIVGPLGVGGMGVVYRARDEKLGRLVALKTLPAERVGDRKARARLVREARSAAALEHPAIAQIFDVGEVEDGGAFLVMELVKGETLRTLLRSDAITREELLDVLGQVGSALDHAHSHGVIHRDIKPDNIMVREDGRAALLDFGLAKDVAPPTKSVSPDSLTADGEHLTKEGALIGTLSYLAPEQARGKGVGPKSDQFALATTAYEALAGQLPWDGENVAAVLAQILIDDAPPPSSFESSLPLPVDRVFARALAKDPEDRFESSAGFVAELVKAFEDRAVDAPAVVRRAPGGSPPWLIGVAAAAGLLTVGLVISLLWDPGPDPDEPPAAPPFQLTEQSVIGCPVLEASGVDEPAGWLGAMGADLACRNLTWRLGGDAARTRVPAELLALPRVADDDFPADPYGAADVRERTLEAANALDAWLDGTVARSDSGVTVRLAFMAPGRDEPVAQGSAESEALYIAVSEAMQALVDDAETPIGGETLEPTIAEFTGTDSVQGVLLLEELAEASLVGVGLAERCRALIGLGDTMRLLHGDIGRLCTRWGVSEASSLTPPELDRSSPAALALTAQEYAETLEEQELRSIADELGRARREEQNPYARAVLARGEIQIWEQLSDMDRARDLLLAAAEDLPRDWFIRVHLVRSMLRTPGAYAATRALAAWHPGSPEAWRTVALPIQRDSERALPFLRRAYLSGGTLPLHGIFLANVLLREGRREETRAIAARYATGGPDTRLAGTYLAARVLITEAQFGEAHDRLAEALMAAPRFGHLLDGDVSALSWFLTLSRLLGRERESADPLVQHLILSEPHRLLVDQPHYELPAIALCMAASPEIARPCLVRLREIREARAARAGRVRGAAELLSGAERYIEGDTAGAAAAWRPLVRSRSPFVRPEVFELTGETAALERLERGERGDDDLAGARLVDVREARRAAAAGDQERARELAERVIAAWGIADVPVPAVAQMQALLSEL